MQIEQLITEFAPTMLLVEHDNVFRDISIPRNTHDIDPSDFFLPRIRYRPVASSSLQRG